MKVFLIWLLLFLALTLIGVPISFVYGWSQPETKVEPAGNNEIELLDSDNDGMGDWFEENIAGTNPYVYNARFVIVFWVSVTNTRDAPVPYDPTLYAGLISFFTDKEKIPAENCFFLMGNWQDGATGSNLRSAIQTVAQKSDEESFVYVYLASHGGEDLPTMWCADGNGYEYGDSLLYEEVGRMLNEIKCKSMLVSVFSCAYETALEPLVREASFPRVVILGNRESIGVMGERTDYYSISDVIYGNGDGYVSLEEVIAFEVNDYDLYSGAGEVENSWREGKIINDPWNLAPNFYLGDYIPTYYSENKVILTNLKETGQYNGWYNILYQLKE